MAKLAKFALHLGRLTRASLCCALLLLQLVEGITVDLPRRGPQLAWPPGDDGAARFRRRPASAADAAIAAAPPFARAAPAAARAGDAAASSLKLLPPARRAVLLEAPARVERIFDAAEDLKCFSKPVLDGGTGGTAGPYTTDETACTKL